MFVAIPFELSICWLENLSRDVKGEDDGRELGTISRVEFYMHIRHDYEDSFMGFICVRREASILMSFP